MLKKTEITEQLKKLIEDEREITINDDDEKLDIDSFTMMLVILYVKDHLGIQLNMDKLDFDAFTSLNTLAEMILAEATEQTSA